MREIAPTVGLATFLDRDWKVTVREAGRVLGAEGRMERALEDYEQRIEQFRSPSDVEGVTASLVNFRDQDDINLYTDSCARDVLDEVGFDRPPGHPSEDPDQHRMQISIERLPEVDADVLFYFVGSAATGPAAAAAETRRIQSNPLWGQLEAVRQERVYETDPRWWFSCGSVQAAERILDDLFDLFVDAR